LLLGAKPIVVANAITLSLASSILLMSRMIQANRSRT
jgi:hypothetical protein